MLKYSLTLATASVVLFTLGSAVVAQTVPGVPIAVICYSQEKEWRIGYLYRVTANGGAVSAE